MYTDYDKQFNEKHAEGRPTFRIGGQTFTARARLPWKKFNALVNSLQGDQPEAEDSLNYTEAFMQLVLVKVDKERFALALEYDGTGDEDDDDDERIISPEQINKLVEDLLEYYTGKDAKQEKESTPSSNATPEESNSPAKVININPKVG